MLAMAADDPARLVRLLDKLTLLDEPRVERVIATVFAFAESAAADADKELVRDGLRSLLNRWLSFGRDRDAYAFGTEKLDRCRRRHRPATSSTDPT